MPELDDRPAVSAAADDLCDRFEDALRRGERPRIEEWLLATRESVAAELAAVELDHRVRTGESATAADYFARFPALAADPAAAVLLVGVEFRAAAARGPGTSAAGFAARYPALSQLPEWSNGPWAAGGSAETAVYVPTPVETVDAAGFDPAAFLAAVLAPPAHPGDVGRLGDFHVLGVLGAGGMGVVLRAEDPVLGRSVAVKLMRPDVAARPGARARFLREARSAAAVEHPRVVVIHHVGEWNGTPYLVMPLMAGRSLARRLAEGPPVPLADAVRFAREAAEGLAAAHAKGLTHRDVKPDNIWIEETAEGTHVRLLDFGLARGDETDAVTRPGMIVGTPQYMAPEQAAGRRADARSDLFALGCVLYELLTGRRAFPGRDLMAVLAALASADPPPPQGVPPALADLTTRLLAKDPARRPTSAADVAAVLRRIEREPNSRPSGRNRARVVAVAVLACGLGLTSWWAACGRGPAEAGPHAAPPAEPLRVTAVEVHHFTTPGDVPRGVLGRESFDPRLGDKVQLAARLSRPGYAYLILFRPDGVADLCFPADEDTPPPSTDTPRYPAPGVNRGYGLREGTGLWVLAVVASDRPLPAYREWRTAHPAAIAAWVPVTTLPAGLVWRDDGMAPVDVLTAAGPTPTVRGKDEELTGPTAAIRSLTAALRIAGPAETASTIGFAVSTRN